MKDDREEALAEILRESRMLTDEEIEKRANAVTFEYDYRGNRRRKFWQILAQIEAEQSLKKPESPLEGEIII